MTRDQQIIELRKTGISFSEIGRRLGVSKNVVQGVIYRKAQDLVSDPEGRTLPRTLFDRCNALHARMDAVLAETKDIGRVPVTTNPKPAMTWNFPRSVARGVLAK